MEERLDDDACLWLSDGQDDFPLEEAEIADDEQVVGFTMEEAQGALVEGSGIAARRKTRGCANKG